MKAVLAKAVVLACAIQAVLADVTIPAGGTPAIASGGAKVYSLIGPGEYGSAQIVNVSGQSFTDAHRITVKTLAPAPYNLQLHTKNAAKVTKGDVILGIVHARRIKAFDETGEAKCSFIFELGASPYTKSVIHPIKITTSHFKQYFIPFKAKETYEVGKASANLWVAYKPQTIEIGGVQVLNYRSKVKLEDLPRNSITYSGMEPNAPWRAEAQKRIEQHRKADITIRVTDKNGKPVRGASVNVKMKKHAFGFGSAVVCRLLMETSNPDYTKYTEMVMKLFNRVVIENELKWYDWAWENMSTRKRTLGGLQKLLDNGIEIRGHNLVWPSFKNTAGDVKKLSNDKAALRKRINDHIRDEVGTLKGKIAEWDVINEPYDNHDLMDILGDREMVEWFTIAHETDPDATMYINDYGILSNGGSGAAHQNHYEKTIKFLLDNGAPVEGIGLQSHFGEDLTAPSRVYALLERYAKFGLELQSTEFDISFGMPDEQAQANYLRDFMTIVFSHPKVTGIVMWGFWEGRHWRPQAALFRKDWSIKPNGKMWQDLVFKKWWTDVNATTDSDGKSVTRGFLGDYEITVSHDGASKTLNAALNKDGLNVNVDLKSVANKSLTPSRNENSSFRYAFAPMDASSASVRIDFAIPTHVETFTMTIRNCAGRLIRKIGGFNTSERRRLIEWDGTDIRGAAVPNGTYIVSLEAGDFVRHIDFTRMIH